MAEENKKNEKEEKISEDLRYKYIGFDIFPKKGKDFWKNEEEKREHLKKVKEEKSQATLLDRDHSLIKVAVFSKVDKIVLTVASSLLAISLFMPWFSFQGKSYLGLSFVFTLGGPLGGVLPALFLILLSLTILSSFAVGVLTLLSLFKKYGELEGYLADLKKKLKLNLIPLILWVLVLLVSIIGMSTPSGGALGAKGWGESFNVLTLFAISSYGMWFSLSCLIINSVKISDL